MSSVTANPTNREYSHFLGPFHRPILLPSILSEMLPALLLIRCQSEWSLEICNFVQFWPAGVAFSMIRHIMRSRSIPKKLVSESARSIWIETRFGVFLDRACTAMTMAIKNSFGTIRRRLLLREERERYRCDIHMRTIFETSSRVMTFPRYIMIWGHWYCNWKHSQFTRETTTTATTTTINRMQCFYFFVGRVSNDFPTPEIAYRRAVMTELFININNFVAPSLLISKFILFHLW